jgi:hypothetical protein
LECEVEVKSWTDNLRNDKFKDWYKRIKIDFDGDKNGKGILQSFRDAVIEKTNLEILKGCETLNQSIRFTLRGMRLIHVHFFKILM